MKTQPMTRSGGGVTSTTIGGFGGFGSATVSGVVWQDNNGDGLMDNGEAGIAGDTVELLEQGGVVDTDITGAGGNYTLTDSLLGPSPSPGFEVVVGFPNSFDYATISGVQGTGGQISSDIDMYGFTKPFDLAAGDAVKKNAGMASMNVNTTDDDPGGALGGGQVTLRDAILTGNNGNFDPLVILAGGPPAVTFYTDQQGDQLSGTISLQAALPDLITSYDIDGPGSSLLAVNANLAPAPIFRVFTIRAGTTRNIIGLTIQGGTANGDDGGGIYNAGTLTLTNDLVYFNQARAKAGAGGDGGGIYNAGGAMLTMNNTQVEENSADGYGGGVYNQGTFVSNSSQITHVNTAQYGGGIANQGSLATTKLQQNTDVEGNNAMSNGGGIYNSAGTVSLTGTSGFVEGNSAPSGGGIFVNSGKLTWTIDFPVDDNKATTGDGGGIYIKNGSVTGSASGEIKNNSAQNGNGGGIFNLAGTLTLNGALNNPTQIVGPSNSAINGGGMYLGKASTTMFNGVTVSGNQLVGNMGKGKGVAYENGAIMNGLPAGLSDKDDPNGNPVQV